MRVRPASAGFAVALALAAATRAAAQSAPPIQGKTTTVEGLTMADTITQLVKPVGAPHIGEALGLATKVEVATAPFGSPSGGFVIKLDTKTGLQVRTATTFGPTYAERALTSGEGNVTAGVSFMTSTYDRLEDCKFNGCQLLLTPAASPGDARSGIANLALSSSTTVIAARVGVTDRLDIGVVIPFVTVKVSGTTSLRNGNGDILTYAKGQDAAAGLGDAAGIVKYRFKSFGTDLPDPGGLAIMATIHVPTGNTDNLRGLGVTRTLLSLIASGGKGKLRPHANVGYEWWSKGVGAPSDFEPNGSVEARHQYQYAAGIEFEAAPKTTLVIDVVGRKVLGGGRVGFQQDTAVALPEGIRKLELAPGLKVNLKAKLLLALDALIALSDVGLYARVTPMAGIYLTF